MAPEVIRGNYTSKCDMWSIGVLTYMLLAGKVPFKGDSNQELFQEILNFRAMNYSIPELARRSVGSIDFMKKLLHEEPDLRFPAHMISDHAWLKKLGKFTIDAEKVRKSLASFRSFRSV